VSLTVTVNEQLAVLFEASVAVQDTVVTPFWKVDPEAGEQTTEHPTTPCGPLPGAVPPPELHGGQLSVTVGSAKVTTAVQAFGAAFMVIGAGQVTIGGCASLAVTVVGADGALEQALTVTTTV
jgi:hypothetical protein